MDGVKRGSRDWRENGKSPAWLAHATGQLEAANRLGDRPYLAANLDAADCEYLAECRKKDMSAGVRSRRVQALVYALLVGFIARLVGWINQSYIKEQLNWYTVMRPYMLPNVRPYVLTAQAEHALTRLEIFRECARDYPAIIVLPQGSYTM